MAEVSSVVNLANSGDTVIDPATEGKQDTIINSVGGLDGAATDGSVALASADTWYQVPGTAPTSEYILVVTKENAAGTIRWSFTNGGTPSATNGNKMTSSNIVFHLAASEVVYFGSSTAGDDVNWTTKIV